MTDQDPEAVQFYAATARLLRREALRRAAEELNTMSGPGLEGTMARISAEVTDEAERKRAAAARAPRPGVSGATPVERLNERTHVF